MSSLDIVPRHRYIKGDLVVGDAFPFRLAAVRERRVFVTGSRPRPLPFNLTSIVLRRH